MKVGLNRDEDERRVKMVRQLIGTDCDLVRFVSRLCRSSHAASISHCLAVHPSNCVLYVMYQRNCFNLMKYFVQFRIAVYNIKFSISGLIFVIGVTEKLCKVCII